MEETSNEVPARTWLRKNMRRTMRFKSFFDLATISIIACLVASYYRPDLIKPLDGLITDSWYWILVTIIVAKETGRWLGDHESNRYILPWVSVGELYALAFFTLPFFLGMSDALSPNSQLTLAQHGILEASVELMLWVVPLYIFTEFSKEQSVKQKEYILVISKLFNRILKWFSRGNSEA